MNHILQVRKNIYYEKNEEGEFKRLHEIVLVVDEPKYTRTNEGNVIRERGCKELRFTIPSDEAYEEVLQILKSYKDVDETDLN